MKTNVYKLVLGVFVTLFAINVNAQDYQYIPNYEYIPMVKSGLQLWTCDQGYYGHDDTDYRFKKYALTNEDTIIDNITYKKLYLYSNTEFDSSTATYIGGLRENSQKQVFYRGVYGISEINEMIYDFSLSVGDTFSGGSFNMDYPNIILKVQSIDTINYFGIARLRFTISTMDSQLAGKWIEGIGNEEGLFFPYHTNTAEFWGITRCYTYNGELEYVNYTHGAIDCITPIMGIEDVLNDNSVILYPNPTNSEVKISSQNIINSIEIFNSLGQRVYQSVVNSNTKTIDISSFVNGVYILGVNTENGVIREKIIKN